MCGFAGFFPSINKEKDNFFLQSMLKRIKYRGPDKTSTFRNSKIALGHHRLSIIDLKGGNQPTVDKNTKDCLVFNGEIYGYKKSAKQLKDKGIQLRDSSDTEVLLKLLINFGIEKTLKRIDGMFSFVYFNSKENAIYLARDRTGEKPLYYAQFKNYLIFGSEIKTITDFPLFKKTLNYSSIADYLHLDYISLDKTLFSEIQRVLPGQYIKFHNKQITSKIYWNFNQKIKSSFSEDITISYLENLIEESVKQRLIADVPVGLFLSGGIDSSIIAYYAKKYSSKIKSFTIKMDNKSYDESEYASIVSKHLEIKNHTLLLQEKDLLESLSHIENKIDEPISDPSIIPTYLVCKLAKRYVKVALSGDGADELFSGYSPFKHIFIMKILSCFPKFTGEFLYKIFSSIPYKDEYMSFLFLLKHISKGIGHQTNQQIFRWMSSFTKNDIDKIFLSSFKDKFLEGEDIISFLGNDKVNKKTSTHDQITQIFFENYLPNDILTKVDRASMYNSLEVRAPFLEKNIMEFSSTIKSKIKIKRNTKNILRKICKKKLPEIIVKRKKHGFAIPLSKMLRTSLKEKVSDTLTSNKTRILEFVDKKEIKNMLNSHFKGQDNRKMIWSLYMLEKSINNNFNS